MKSFTAADLDRLAQGQPLDAEVFRAIFADPEAVDDLARRLQVQQLRQAAEPEPPEPINLPDMDVSWDELSRYAERRYLEPARREAVERFLGKYDPDALADAGADTHVDFRSEQDTHLGWRPEKEREAPKRERGDAGRA